MEEADALASRIGILSNGNVKALGSPQHLKDLHGQGYKITCQAATAEAATSALSKLSTRIEIKKPQVIGKSLQLEMPLSGSTGADALEQLSNTFVVFEELKTRGVIVDYSIAQNTLAHVFMSLVKGNQ